MKRIIFLIFFLINIVLYANDNFTIVKNLHYTNDEKTTLDIFLPKTSLNKRVIFMVHGGGWIRGDKALKNVVKNKVKYWVSKGFIFVSTNYRLVPNVDVIEQEEDIAKAFKYTQKYLAKFGVNEKDFILMGHSAGAHLVSLLTVDRDIKNKYNIKPWLATISLDIAAYNLIKTMENRHSSIYDKVFGKDKTYWKKLSAYHLLDEKIIPFLAVCSLKKVNSCIKAKKFVSKIETFGSKAKVLEVNLNHKNINKNLGLNNNYTKDVDNFIYKLL